MYRSVPDSFIMPVKFIYEDELDLMGYRSDDLNMNDNLFMNGNTSMNNGLNMNMNNMNMNSMMMDQDNDSDTNINMNNMMNSMNSMGMNMNTDMNNDSDMNMNMGQNMNNAMSIDAAKNSIKQLLDASFASAFMDLSRLNKNQMLNLILEVFEELMELHVENVDCFKKVKTQGFNGMSFEQIENMHLEIARRYFNFHFNGFACGKYVQPGVNNIEFNEIENNITDTVENAFNSIKGMASGLSAQQIEDIHVAIFTNLFNLLIKYVPCFSGIDSATANRKLNDHIAQFKQIYEEHIKLLGCK